MKEDMRESGGGAGASEVAEGHQLSDMILSWNSSLPRLL